jgi:hypothetical protein
MICIFFVGRRKINFGFDGSNTELLSVDPLASKSGGKGLDKSKGKASSSLLEKRTRGTEAATDTRPKKIREKGLVQVQKSPTVKPPPPISTKGDLTVIPTSSATTFVKEPREIRSSPFSQAKFPKETRTGFCSKEGLPTNILDIVGVYLPGCSTIMKSEDKRPAPSDLGEYAREAVRAVELPYFARNIEDVPATLTTVMENVFEAFSLMGHVWDDYTTREGKVTFPKIQSNDLSKVIVKRDYWRGQVTVLNRDLGLLKDENK